MLPRPGALIYPAEPLRALQLTPRAAVRVVMRLVVVLFAESRDLLPRDNALALLLAFGSANTWQKDFHLSSYVSCPTHTFG